MEETYLTIKIAITQQQLEVLYKGRNDANLTEKLTKELEKELLKIIVEKLNDILL